MHISDRAPLRLLPVGTTTEIKTNTAETGGLFDLRKVEKPSPQGSGSSVGRGKRRSLGSRESFEHLGRLLVRCRVGISRIRLRSQVICLFKGLKHHLYVFFVYS